MRRKRWKEDILTSAYDQACLGLTSREICDVLKCHPPTFKKWLKEKPELRQIIKRGQELYKEKKEENEEAGIAGLDLSLIHNTRKRRFLIHYAQCGNVSKAARKVGVARKTHYSWYEKDPVYQEQFQYADEIATDRLEEEATRRAVEGVGKLKFYKGAPIMIPCDKDDENAVLMEGPDGTPMWQRPYVEHEYSDRLLTVLLKARRPEKYMQQPKTNVSINQTVNKNQINLNLSEIVAMKERRQNVLTEETLDDFVNGYIEEKHGNEILDADFEVKNQDTEDE